MLFSKVQTAVHKSSNFSTSVPTLVVFFFLILISITLLAVSLSMWDLSSLTRDRTCIPCIESMES